MAKDRKGKLPKRVAGVKIPKELRKGGDRLIAKANTPEGRAALAKGAAVVASAAAAMAQAAVKAPTVKLVPPAAPTGSQPGEPGVTKPDPLGDAIGAGVAMLGQLFAKK